MKTITLKMVIKGDSANAVYEHLKDYIKDLDISYYINTEIKKSFNREHSIVEGIAKALELQFPVGTEVVLKKELKSNSIIKRPEIPIGTKGKIASIEQSDYHPFQVKFENGKTIYCSFNELEEVKNGSKT